MWIYRQNNEKRAHKPKLFTHTKFFSARKQSMKKKPSGVEICVPFWCCLCYGLVIFIIYYRVSLRFSLKLRQLGFCCSTTGPRLRQNHFFVGLVFSSHAYRLSNVWSSFFYFSLFKFVFSSSFCCFAIFVLRFGWQRILRMNIPNR